MVCLITIQELIAAENRVNGIVKTNVCLFVLFCFVCLFFSKGCLKGNLCRKLFTSRPIIICAKLLFPAGKKKNLYLTLVLPVSIVNHPQIGIIHLSRWGIPCSAFAQTVRVPGVQSCQILSFSKCVLNLHERP